MLAIKSVPNERFSYEESLLAKALNLPLQEVQRCESAVGNLLGWNTSASIYLPEPKSPDINNSKKNITENADKVENSILRSTVDESSTSHPASCTQLPIADSRSTTKEPISGSNASRSSPSVDSGSKKKMSIRWLLCEI